MGAVQRGCTFNSGGAGTWYVEARIRELQEGQQRSISGGGEGCYWLPPGVWGERPSGRASGLRLRVARREPLGTFIPHVAYAFAPYVIARELQMTTAIRSRVDRPSCVQAPGQRP